MSLPAAIENAMRQRWESIAHAWGSGLGAARSCKGVGVLELGSALMHTSCWKLGRSNGVQLSRALVIGIVAWAFFSISLPAVAFVVETPTEFHASGDFDGNGRLDLLIVDRGTGAYRIGYQLSDGTVSWVESTACGIKEVSGVGVGRLTSTNRDAFICTAPAANRLTLVDVGGTNALPVPVAVHISPIGPNSVGVIDIGGARNTPLHDLFVGSVWNSGLSTRCTLVRNTNGMDFGVLGDFGTSSPLERMNRITLKAGSTDRIAVIFRGATDTLRVYDLSSGSIVQTLSQSLAANVEYVMARFDPTNLLGQFVFYWRGTNRIEIRQVIEPTPGSYTLSGPRIVTLSRRVQNLYPVPGSSKAHLLVVYDGGYAAEIFELSESGELRSIQEFMAPTDRRITGAGWMGGNHFALYFGNPGAGVSEWFQAFVYDGQSYSSGSLMQLPFVGRYSACGNVLLFRFEPFVTNAPHLIRVLNAGDWTSRFQYTGAPPVVTVTAERYVGPSEGLRNPTGAALGYNPPLANFGLVNQYTNFISVFSLKSPAGDEVSEVKISPDPGRYTAAIKITFVASDSTHRIYYRFGTGSWQLYSGPVYLFTNAVVQYYGRPPTGNAKSSIKSAAYTFDAEPTDQDADDDGVPDFVELASGLDPDGGPDSDGDGYSDLEELVRGTDPLAAGSVPSGVGRLEFKATFDRVVTPRPYDGPANAITYAAVGTPMRVFAVPGAMLSAGVVTNVGVPGVTNPACYLSNIVVEPEDRLLVEATELHYDIFTLNPDKRLGRELVGLLPAPRFEPVRVVYKFGGGDLLTEARAWIAAASNAWVSARREVSKGDLTVQDMLTAALVELKIGRILLERGMNIGTNITLFPFRASDAGRVGLTRDILLWLERETTNSLPGWRMHTIYNVISNLVETSTLGTIVSLRAVAYEIFDISSTYNNSSPATYIPPLDELRYFLHHCTYDSNYLAKSVLTNLFASACAGVETILAAVPPRPITNVIVVAVASNPGRPADSFELYGGSTRVYLYKEDGSPYDLPDSFGVVPGSLVQVRGYADVPGPTNALAIEVINVSLVSTPTPSDADSDGNLLVDSWERLFFGGAHRPFGDWDGDGYQDLQEMFEGTDPRDPLSVPAAARVRFDLPYVQLIRVEDGLRIRFEFPGAYMHRFKFGVRSTPDLSTPFSELPVPDPIPVVGSPNMYDLVLEWPETSTHFYMFYMRLR